MNRTEHLLTCLSEECGESTQVAAKAGRFGLDHVWPEKNETNRRILEREIADILGVAEELGLVIRQEDIAAKREKLRKMMDFSVELGTLDLTKIEPGAKFGPSACVCRGVLQGAQLPDTWRP